MGSTHKKRVSTLTFVGADDGRLILALLCPLTFWWSHSPRMPTCSEDGTATRGARPLDGLPVNPLTVEEVERRQAHLAKLRAVLSYQEEKFKRIKRIKSKKSVCTLPLPHS